MSQIEISTRESADQCHLKATKKLYRETITLIIYREIETTKTRSRMFIHTSSVAV